LLTIPKSESYIKRYSQSIFVSIAVVFLVGLSIFSWQTLSNKNLNEVQVSIVNKGDVIHFISGQGRLIARKNTSIISEVSGTLTEIISYPGSEVTEGDVILTFKNPQLNREKDQAALALLEAQASHQSVLANLEREEISLTNDIEIAESEIRFTNLELSTLELLLEEGGVAKLDFLRAKTNLEQAKLKLSMSERNLLAFKRTRTAQEKASQYRLQAAEKSLSIAEYDLKNLNIVAIKTGLLSSFSENVELGKLISKGEVLAQITDPKSLYVSILISANDVINVEKYQKVEIDIRGNIVQGEILRIHPNVENNQIVVEATISELLPEIARENLDVSVKIISAHLSDVLRVTPPINITYANKAQDIFVLKGDQFVRRKVSVGVLGKEHMEVLNGLQDGDKILLNVPKKLQDLKTIPYKDVTGG
jgi:multidrug resistance efflux pump